MQLHDYFKDFFKILDEAAEAYRHKVEFSITVEPNMDGFTFRISAWPLDTGLQSLHATGQDMATAIQRMQGMLMENRHG